MSIISVERETTTDLIVLERWTALVHELLREAAERADDDRTRARLDGAAEDARSLRRALRAARRGRLHAGEIAELWSILDLWDANQDQYQRLAAEVDPRAHHRWLVRSATVRMLYEARRTEALAS